MHVTLGPLDSIPEGEGKSFQIGSREVAVFRSRQGALFATQALCPHRGGRLADGLLGGATLICPLHSLKFDLETGRSNDAACSLAIYRAWLDPNGQIVIDLGERTDAA